MSRISEISEDQLWLLIRCILALLVSVHGWHRIFDHGVLPFAEYMQQRLPLGYYLVFVLQLMEIVGTIIFAAGYCVSALSLVFSIIYSCSIYFYHSQFGWFQSGGSENGAEYAFALIVCFFACALAFWPNTSLSSSMKWRDCWRPILGKASLSVGAQQFAWRCLAYLLAFLVLTHVGARIVVGNVQAMLAAMPTFTPFPQTLALLATAVQAVSCVAICTKRHQILAFLSLGMLFAGAIVFHHLPLGWIVSGADKDGAEYSFLLMSLALILATHQFLIRRMTSNAVQLSA